MKQLKIIICRFLYGAVLLSLSAHLIAQDNELPAPEQPPLPPPSVLNDTALFLAGLPVNPESPLRFLQSTEASIRHANDLNYQFDLVESHRLKPMRIWAKTQIQPRIPRPETIYYLFGGPDYLSVASIFAEAQVYVLAGLEPIGRVPDLIMMEPDILASSLDVLRFTMRSILEKGFFETREMREDFRASEMYGVLPVLYVFLERTENQLLNTSWITLDENGGIRYLTPNDSKAMGVQIEYCALNAQNSQTLFYFSADISDSALAKDTRFLKFMQRMGEGGSYLKAASYLMHGGDFTTIRSLLLKQSRYVLQDDSGIPLRFFEDGKWDLTFFGNYMGPMEIFREYEQPEMWRAYSNPENRLPLPFGTGYRREDSDSNQLFALRHAMLPPVTSPENAMPEVIPSYNPGYRDNASSSY